jgi:hypothetical protein
VQLADNPDNDPAGDVVVGVFDTANKTFTPTTTSPNAVQVVARRTSDSPGGALRLFVGPLFGVSTVQLTRLAIAVGEFGPAGPGIILLKPNGPKGLEHSGDGTITINGAVQVNSGDQEALYQSGNGTLKATSFEVVGEYKQSGNGQIIGDINEGVDPVSDPFAGLPVPDINNTVLYPIRSTEKFSRGNGIYTLQPGRYIGGIDLNGSDGHYTLEPGIYIIEGGGFKLSGAPLTNISNCMMNEVMIYNCGTGGTTANADQFYLSTDGVVTWTPIRGGVYDGFGLFQHRDLADKKIEISGNGGVNISSIIYAKSAEVQLSGNGGTQVLGGGFVAASMQISGNGSFTVGGDITGGPGSEKVYLVW